MKPVRIALYAVAALAGWVIIAAVALLVFVDPNQFKGQITQVVKEKKQRTLRLEGDLKLKVFPRLAIDLGKTTLSERNSEEPFASVQSARVSVALFPLLKKRLLIDRIVVDGVSAVIRRDAQGHTNFDDLLSSDSSSMEVEFDVAGFELTHGTLALDDAMTHTVATLKNVTAKTGRIADRTPTTLELGAEVDAARPLFKATLALKGKLTFDLQAASYDFTKLDLTATATGLGARDLKLTLIGDAAVDAKGRRLAVKDFAFGLAGDYQGQGLDLTKADVKLNATRVDLSPAQVLLDGLKLAASGSVASSSAKAGGPDTFELKLDAPKLAISEASATGGTVGGSLKLTGAQVLDAKFDAADVAGSAKQFSIGKLALVLDVKQDGQAIHAQLAAPLKGSLQTRVYELPAIAGELSASGPKIPQKTMTAKIAGKLSADLGKESIASVWNARFDESTIDAKLDVSHFAPPAIAFDVGIDRLNVDRYVAPAPKGDEAKAPSAANSSAIDLSWLKRLDASGKLRVGSLQAENIKVQNLALTLKAAGGRMDIAPISANLYQGTLNGSATLASNRSFAVKQTLAGISINPLMKDVLNRDVLEGRGNVSLDLAATGATVDALKRSVDGKASLSLRDGAIKGFNLGEMLRTVKSRLGSLQGGASSETGTANAAQKTDFSELSASFVVKNGVASNNDLSLKSPFLRLGGSGTIDLGSQRIDYTARANIVNTAGGQGGKELAQLTNVPIPVRLAGPFTQLTYTIDWGAIATGALQNKLQEKLQESVGARLFGKPADGSQPNGDKQPAGQDPRKQLEDQLKGGLKGLLGR